MKLKDWMHKNNVKATTMANQMGITAASFSGYVKGKTSPSLENAIKIVRITGGDVQYEDLVSAFPSTVTPDELEGI